MKTIPLTQGQVALVDDEDFARFGHLKWCALWNKTGRTFYAVRSVWNKETKRRKTELLHRVIMDVTDPRVKVDHHNHDTLDCRRRKNLRIATTSQNTSHQSGMRSTNTSGFRGVVWIKRESKWKAQIVVMRKYILLGRFSKKEDAADAYAAANRVHFGAFGGELTNGMTSDNMKETQNTLEENMKNRIPKMVVKLNPAETRRLELFISKSGGQVKASVILGCAPATLSRTINGHTATSALLREKLVEVGVVKA